MNQTLTWNCGSKRFELDQKGEIMGILNTTPDSFSDGGRFSAIDAALDHARAMIAEGAAIIDIGGESTRPGAEPVAESEEISRTVPVIEKLNEWYPGTCISIDTSKAAVARRAIEAGAEIVNDVTGFRDRAMIEAVAGTGVGCVVMHMLGTPGTMQNDPQYRNVVEEVRRFFEQRFSAMTEAGISPESIVFDPGIGFGKRLEDNLELLANLKRLSVGGRPLLLGVSRKSFIGKILQSESLQQRSWPTVAITAHAREQGVRLHRVHEVRKNLQSLLMMEAIQQS